MRRSLAKQALGQCWAAAAAAARADAAASTGSGGSRGAGALAAACKPAGLRGSLPSDAGRAALLQERLASSAAAGCSGRSFGSAAAATAAAAGRALQRQVHMQAAPSYAAATAQRHYWTHVKGRLPAQAWQLPSPSQLVRPSYEWVLGTGYNARVAIINALYAMQPSTHWARMLSLLLAEAVTRRDPLAWCYTTPVTAKEEEVLAAAAAADAAAAAAVLGAGRLGALRRWLSSLIRLLWLLVLFTPAAAAAPLAIGYGRHRQLWMQLLRKTLERAGPAFIKWGQWAATRHDLFPPDFCAELELLHTQAPAHDFPFTETAIQQAFGFGVHDLFSQFEGQPVASGSIGQVHRATLSGAGSRLTGIKEGTVVAVKVRHPGVSEAIERDFALMLAAARAAGSLPALCSLRLEESLAQFAAPLREQVDLAREGYYLHAFNYNFRKERDVSFPVPLYPLVAPSVLVESFERGKHISDYVAAGAGAPHNSVLAKVGARAMLHMMVVDNLVHSDLHPGNILVRLHAPGGAAGAAALRTLHSVLDKASSALGVDLRLPPEALLRPSIILLDAGMATRLGPEDRQNMFGLFESFSRLDGRSVADWVLRFAGEGQRCPDPEAFRRDVEGHFNVLKAAHAFDMGDETSGADALAGVLETVRQHEVTMPGHICATVVTTLVLEGWSHRLDPAHSTLSEVKRIIALKKGDTRLRKAAMWVQGAAERQILDNVPPFEEEGAAENQGLLA